MTHKITTLLITVLTAFSCGVASADPVNAIQANAQNLSSEQIARQCVSACEDNIFNRCTAAILQQTWIACFDPERDDHPQGDEIESLLCLTMVADHAALCSASVSACALECALESLDNRDRR